MGNFFGFFNSVDTSRIKINIKDLSTGRTFSVPVQRPFEYTVDQLQSHIISRLPHFNKSQMSLKYKKKDIIDERATDRTLAQALNIESSEAINSISLFLEQVDNRGGVMVRDWTLHVKTLTGRTYDISFSSPHYVSVMGLKLLIEEETEGSIKPEQMRLVLDHQQLEDNNSLVQDIEGLSNDSTLHLVLR